MNEGIWLGIFALAGTVVSPLVSGCLELIKSYYSNQSLIKKEKMDIQRQQRNHLNETYQNFLKTLNSLQILKYDVEHGLYKEDPSKYMRDYDILLLEVRSLLPEIQMFSSFKVQEISEEIASKLKENYPSEIDAYIDDEAKDELDFIPELHKEFINLIRAELNSSSKTNLPPIGL